MTCSELAAVRGEPMVGTAFTQGGVLLVEQPGPWGHAGLRESHFTASVAVQLEDRAAAAGLRVLAIRAPGRAGLGAVRRWGLRLPGESVLRWGRYGQDDELLRLPIEVGQASFGAVDLGSVYLVCAHSKRDRCCAVRGRPIAQALLARRPGRVFECSHTGGHRFAPNVLALPIGALYGHVERDRVADVITATECGEVIPELLRGVIGHDGVEQAALVYARLQLGIVSAKSIAVHSRTETAADAWSVRLAVGDQAYDVMVEVDVEPLSFVSCGKPTAKAQSHFRARSLTAPRR